MKRALDQMKRVFDLCSTAGAWEGVLVLVLVLEESERARARARERERDTHTGNLDIRRVLNLAFEKRDTSSASSK